MASLSIKEYKTTTIGGDYFATVVQPDFNGPSRLLLETGDFLLLETGDKLLLEI